MEIISRPKPVNFNDFIPENSSPQTKYGLPTKVQYCRKCVFTNQRPNSAVEYDHVPNSKKSLYFSMKMEFVMYGRFTQHKKAQSIGVREINN